MSSKDKPNMLMMFGDDIGWWNISYNNNGQMGYRTPNIDRIAHEGLAFTDYYGQQSCTAGRAAFITGQNPVRTGLTKVGIPGSDLGIRPEDPTIAELLKPLGYVTAQFGKNHLGDKDEFLPTNHGFDEFFGNLYHLNAEEEPELSDYPKDPEFRKKFGPRGVLHCFAGGKIEDTGPLTKKRMETIDDEITDHSLRFLEDNQKTGKPFFVWYNTTAMHLRTHPAPKHLGKSGRGGFYNDVMVAHDENIGKLLNKLDELGIADSTIVLYSTDNGPHFNSWPDAAITPFRSEKNTNWEGAWRVLAFARWPGKFPAGKVLNDIVSHQDWLPTLLAAAGEPDIKEKLEPVNITVIALKFAETGKFDQEFRTLAKLMEKPEKAEEFISWRDNYLNQIKEKTGKIDQKIRVFLGSGGSQSELWSSRTIGSGMHDAVTMGGGHNIVSELPGEYSVKIDPEWVIEKDPEVIIAMNWGDNEVQAGSTGYNVNSPDKAKQYIETVLNNKVLGNTSAVINKKVYVIDGPLMLGSTTTYIGAIYCAKWFYPELFKDMDPEAIHKEFIEKWIGARFGGIWAYPQAS